ncbi:MAG: hydroxyacid dehydrogenase [Candidatus Undinarchaeales archaeon]
MKILAADKISKEAIEELEKAADVVTDFNISPEKLSEEIKKYDIIIVRSRTKITKDILEVAPKLRAVVRAGVGLDNIDLEYAKEKGVKVINTPEAPTESVAELAIGLMLSLARNIPEADHSIKEGEWKKKALKGFELKGKTLGVIGLGRIGKRVAEIASSLGMKIVAHDRNPHAYFLEKVNGKNTSLIEMLKEADFLTIHLPLTSQTKDMISEKELISMKSSAYIINTARGGIINEDDLYKALKNEEIAGAALDVFWDKKPFESKIMEVRGKIIFTPHLGSTTHEAQEKVGKLLVEKIMKLIEHEKKGKV